MSVLRRAKIARHGCARMIAYASILDREYAPRIAENCLAGCLDCLGRSRYDLGMTNTKATIAVLFCLALFIFGMSLEAHQEGRTPRVESITEDDPQWNCLTMGNHICGPEWKPMPQELADAFAEGTMPGDDTRDWESCLLREGDTSYVVCPDGFTTHS